MFIQESKYMCAHTSCLIGSRAPICTEGEEEHAEDEEEVEDDSEAAEWLAVGRITISSSHPMHLIVAVLGE